MVQTNPDGTTVESRYHVDDDRRGLLETQTTREGSLNDPVLAVLRNTWTGHNDAEPKFLRLSSRVLEQWQDGSSYGSTSETFVYDLTNGFITEHVKSGDGAQAITVRHTYANYGTWLWKRTLEELEGSIDGVIRSTTYVHENNTGNTLEKRIGIGADTMVETFLYDDVGNPHTITQTNGVTKTLTYDATSRTYLATETDGLTSQSYDYDQRHGVLLNQSTDHWLQTNGFDPLGRLVSSEQTNLAGNSIYKQRLIDYYDLETYPYQRERTAVDSGLSQYTTRWTYVDWRKRVVEEVNSFTPGEYLVKRYQYDSNGMLEREWGTVCLHYVDLSSQLSTGRSGARNVVPVRRGRATDGAPRALGRGRRYLGHIDHELRRT